jgi:hypothetical protein
MTRQSNARDFEPSFYTPIDRQSTGRVANHLKRILFYVTLAYFRLERSITFQSAEDIFSSHQHLL